VTVPSADRYDCAGSPNGGVINTVVVVYQSMLFQTSSRNLPPPCGSRRASRVSLSFLYRYPTMIVCVRATDMRILNNCYDYCGTTIIT
jgi:hypothetical protein